MQNFFLGLFFVILTNSVAQTIDDKKKIVASYDLELLSKLNTSFTKDNNLRLKRVDSFSRLINIPKRITDGFIEKELFDFDENGFPVYSETSNLASSSTIRANDLYNGGLLGLNLQGQGMSVCVWDSGPALETHVEFPNSKVNVIDFVNYSDHGTHVMGTILAHGTNPNARGIAFQASGKSFDWDNDLGEMANEASQGLLSSNHSYWSGSSANTWMFGAYDSRAQQFDQITYAAPFYLPVVAAGNDRNSNATTVISNQNQNKFGYDLIRGMCNAKNILTIGAVTNVSNYIDPTSVEMSSFSSWGPTDDGRIKPDVVAKGVSVFSSIKTTNTSYDIKQGTSMAAPAVTGACLLLQQHHNNLFSSFMKSSTLKGLILHSSREAGNFNGPDYQFGWGLVDVSSAASILSSKSLNTAIVDELNLINNSTYSRTINVSSSSNIRVSICWTDPAPNSFNNLVIDPSNTYLVNDLDIKLTKNGIDFFPWSLNKNVPDNAATRTNTNNIDNFERIDLENAFGAYTLTVSHKGTLFSGNQNFSLIVSGSNLLLSDDDFSSTNKTMIFPNPTSKNISVVLNGLNIKHYMIYDIQGRLVINQDEINSNFDIDLSNINSGVYLLKLITDEGIITQKIIKN